MFWPKLKITKGDLMRYYVRVAPYILPVVDGRPLIMKRFPNGIDGQPFYQHKAPEKVPPGVRAAKVAGDSVASRPIGGNLITLLYMTQLAVDLAGSVVLARRVAAHGRPCARSISIRCPA